MAARPRTSGREGAGRCGSARRGRRTTCGSTPSATCTAATICSPRRTRKIAADLARAAGRRPPHHPCRRLCRPRAGFGRRDRAAVAAQGRRPARHLPPRQSRGMLLAFLRDPGAARADVWLGNGGRRDARAPTACRSIRSTVPISADVSREAFAARAAAQHHRAFLGGLDALGHASATIFFCHAGIRPGVPLDRAGCRRTSSGSGRTSSTAAPTIGVVVVHGHTPGAEPEVLPNRINIDTGAVFSGRLTCLALEGSSYRFL